MRTIRWIAGLVLVAAFVAYNMFVYDGHLLLKIANLILFCGLFVLFRVAVGPTPADRIVSVEILGVLTIGLLAVLGAYYEEGFLMDIALIWALLSFIASLAFAKILEGRTLDA